MKKFILGKNRTITLKNPKEYGLAIYKFKKERDDKQKTN